MAHEDHRKPSKQHAQRRDVHRRHPLWVYDDDDWDVMYGENKVPTGDLICPEDGCRAELVAVERKSGTRFLRNRKGTADCGHAFGRPSGGGPPSPEHRWLQQRLAMLCADLGYEAIPEHAESRADVWVTSTPPLAIEVQRWPTAFAKRGDARRAKGAKVLWLLPERASSPKANRALFQQPAARIRVMHREDRTKEAKPWEPGHSGRVLVWIGATVMKIGDDETLVSAGNYDALVFLREVLSGERRWYGPNEPGFAFGSGWARPGDVEQMRAALRRATTAQVASSGTIAVANLPQEEVETPAARPTREKATPPCLISSIPALAPDGDNLESFGHQQSPDTAAPDSLVHGTRETPSPTPPIMDVPPRPSWFQRLKDLAQGRLRR